MASWIATLFQRARTRVCNHRFALEDLRMVNPNGDHDRVEWPCADCGKSFRAHCGLDITPKHGHVFRRNPYSKSATPPDGAKGER